jgi:hypothetical protein
MSVARPDRAGDDGGPAPHYRAEDVRGGEIILRSRSRRLIFIAGLVAFCLIALIVRFGLLR